MKGLDGRHRDKNGQIEKKHGNTKIKNLVGDYPILKKYNNENRLAAIERRLKVDSLDEVLKITRRQNRQGH